ncbi:hypothetical protein JKP88DRAFT_243475 [Tribonema minus]|uniref:histidine kinase n=1 Tax=Tribonema minus TaxID=303371 RepID=A0A836CK82_9STRA|nr:hypothetical protein JKP88DRAFT_243475 [Tribonema minus]
MLVLARVLLRYLQGGLSVAVQQAKRSISSCSTPLQNLLYTCGNLTLQHYIPHAAAAVKARRPTAHEVHVSLARSEKRAPRICNSDGIASDRRSARMGGQKFSFFDLVPECVVILDGDTGIVLDANARFAAHVAPLSRVKGMSFVQNFINPDEATRFNVALAEAKARAKAQLNGLAEGDRAVEEDIPVLREMVTLVLGKHLGDMPVYRRYDWAVSAEPESGHVILSGRLVTVVDDARRAAENELIDYFNKAPIALHWLSSSGHVLWANETEMNVLGYTAEEYIGQPIMRFCPDEEELVLESVQNTVCLVLGLHRSLGTVGGGHRSEVRTGRRMRTRRRTRMGAGSLIRRLALDGWMGADDYACAVRLALRQRLLARDTRGEGGGMHNYAGGNVNYHPDKSFNHTRCFIRDDTARKSSQCGQRRRRRCAPPPPPRPSPSLRCRCCCCHRNRRGRCTIAAAAALKHPPPLPPALRRCCCRRRCRRRSNRRSQCVPPRSPPPPPLLCRRCRRRGCNAQVREARLEAKVEAAARSAAEKEAFIRKTFHEIRTPCHVLLQALSMLEPTLADARHSGGSAAATPLLRDAERVLGEAARQAERLAQVVDDVSDASLFESGMTIAVREAPFEPRRLIGELLRVLRALRPEAPSVRRVARVAPDVPRVLEGDSRLLGRVLQQLLDNAIKFTKEGEVCIAVQRVDGGDRYMFEVSDTGPGMDEGSVNAIFQKYWQGGSAAPRRAQPQLALAGGSGAAAASDCGSGCDVTVVDAFDGGRGGGDGGASVDSSLALDSGNEGLGLGLNVSFNLVQCLGGELSVAAHAGGTTLRFAIPLRAPRDQGALSPSAASGPPSPRSSVQGGSSPDATPRDSLVWEGNARASTSTSTPQQRSFSPDGSLAGSSGGASSGSSTNAAAARRASNGWAVKLPRLLQRSKVLPEVADGDGSMVVRSLSSMDAVGEEEQVYQWQPVVASQAAAAFMRERESSAATADDDDSSSGGGGSAAAAAAAAATLVPAAPPKYAHGVGLEQTRAPHVLLVEDNTICQRVTQHGLVRLGCDCDVASNGRVAVEMLARGAAAGALYDICIMDLRMPEMDGIEATTYIRTKLGMHLPILGFSAEITQEIRHRCVAAGMQGFLAKPASMERLGMEISRLVPHLPINMVERRRSD